MDGSPHVLQEVDIQIVGFFEGLTVEGAVSGGLDWEVDDRSGTCMIDLTLSAEPDFPDRNRKPTPSSAARCAGRPWSSTRTISCPPEPPCLSPHL